MEWAMHRRLITQIGPIVGMTLACVASADAQPRRSPYFGALIGPYSVDADHVTGDTTSIGVTGGMAVLPWLDIEIDVLKPSGVLIYEYTGPSASFTGPGPPDQFVVTKFSNQRRVDVVLSAGVVFHPRAPVRRMTPRFFAGVANHRVRDRTVLSHVYLPPGVTLEMLERTYPSQGWQTRNLGGPTIGGSLTIDITERVSIAPDIRYDYGSIGDEINNVLRSSVRVMWRF
jgi:hypothetical protein